MRYAFRESIVLVSCVLCGCGEGTSTPKPEPVHESQISSTSGDAIFASGQGLHLVDATSQQPVSGVTVTEIPDGSTASYIIVDLQARYRAEMLRRDQLPTSSIYTNGPFAVSAGKTVQLLPLNTFGGITENLASISDAAWKYVLEKLYDHEQMPLDQIGEYLARKLAFTQMEHFSLGFLQTLLPASPYAGLPSVIIEITKATQLIVANLVNWHLLRYYYELGYGPNDMFIVSTPNTVGSKLFNSQILFRPVANPSSAPSKNGSLTVVVVNDATDAELSSATLELVGPSSQRLAYRIGGVTLSSLIPGNYVV